MKTQEKDENARNQAKAQLESIIEMVAALYTENDDDRDKAMEVILNDPLSVEVREDWHSVGDQDGGDHVEFKILLCWGCPACQIVGEIEDGQPVNPRIQYQDWFTNWTDYVINNDKDQEALQTYCEQFYFEEA